MAHDSWCRRQGISRDDLGARISIERLAPHLLGRHVPRRSQDAGRRAPEVRSGSFDGCLGGRFRAPTYTGDAPIDDIHLSEIAQHHVGGLEVPVDDASCVREVDGNAHLGERCEEPVSGVGALRDALPRGASVDDLPEGLAQDARLSHEAPEERERVVLCGANELHRDVAADTGIAAQAHLAHSALSQHPNGPIAGVEAAILERAIGRIPARSGKRRESRPFEQGLAREGGKGRLGHRQTLPRLPRTRLFQSSAREE